MVISQQPHALEGDFRDNIAADAYSVKITDKFWNVITRHVVCLTKGSLGSSGQDLVHTLIVRDVVEKQCQAD